MTNICTTARSYDSEFSSSDRSVPGFYMLVFIVELASCRTKHTKVKNNVRAQLTIPTTITQPSCKARQDAWRHVSRKALFPRSCTVPLPSSNEQSQRSTKAFIQSHVAISRTALLVYSMNREGHRHDCSNSHNVWMM